MKIRKETTYIAETEYGEKVIALGDHAELVFMDGTYHTGEISEITDRVVTITKSDGDYSYGLHEIQDIRMACL